VNFFYDLNMWSSHLCLEKVRGYVRRVADWHQVRLAKDRSNAEAVQHFNALHPSSPFAPRSLDILTSFQPDDTEIQRVGPGEQFLLEQVQAAQHRIQIISPYYYRLKNLDKELLKAAARGVKVELITARNRDIPTYRDFVNANLMHHLVKNGVEVLQVKDKYLHMKGFLFDDRVLTFGRPR
jgi:phosphatidylserine/phosphatidylglycerophosphate/cardiolipin synthase-like enzyme